MQPVVQSFEQQKQFIANASHELRTPLSIIMSGLTVLKTDGRMMPFKISHQMGFGISTTRGSERN